MINSLFDKHPGCRAAVIGSSPTAELFCLSNYDGISIAVNGAAHLGPRYNYFMCGDHKSHERTWFYVDCSDVRVLSNLVASMDKKLYPDDMFPNIKRTSTRYVNSNSLINLPKPVSPHIVFKYKSFKKNELKRKNDYLMFRGTISCCALQLAWIMGARIIDIFGCSFGHHGGSYYFNDNHNGKIFKSQLRVMQDAVDVIRNDGVVINIIGESELL